MKLDMVQIAVNDWSSSVDWYVDKLGAIAVVKEDDDQFALLVFPEGGASVGVAGTDKPIERGDNCRPCIRTNDLDAAVAKLNDAGVPLDAPIRGGDEGFRIAGFRDAEGNLWQLYQLAGR